MTAAVILGDRLAAGLLLPTFFALVEQEHFEQARLVLEEIRTLAPEEFAQDGPSLFVRLYQEKLGYSFLAEGDTTAAVAAYHRALAASEEHTRGRLKVRGALALCRYLTSPLDKEVAAKCRAELEAVADEARAASYPDVVDASTANAVLIADGRTNEWVPFEVT